MSCPPWQATYSTQPTFKNCPEKVPTILANNILIWHVGVYVDFSSTKNVMGCGPKLPSCKLKHGHVTLSTNEN